LGDQRLQPCEADAQGVVLQLKKRNPACFLLARGLNLARLPVSERCEARRVPAFETVEEHRNSLAAAGTLALMAGNAVGRCRSVTSRLLVCRR